MTPCGALDPPMVEVVDPSPRACPAPSARVYVPRHGGLAREILDLESEACFVPDALYERLDGILDRLAGATTPEEVGARLDLGFHVPVRSLAEGLERGVLDCDTAAFLYLTALPASALVELALPDGQGHDVVQTAAGTWDPNGRAWCRPPRSARALDADGVRAYVVRLRATRRPPAEALADRRLAVALDPGSAAGWNDLAWSLLPGPDALPAARRAVALSPTAAHLDTLACAQAAAGDLRGALRSARAAARRSDDPEIDARPATLRSGARCGGADRADAG